MTESNRGKSGRPPADPLFYCRSNTRRFGSVRPAEWMAIVKVLPPIGEVNSPLHLPIFLPPKRLRYSGHY